MEYGLFDETPAEREIMRRAAKAAQPTPPSCKQCRQRIYASFFFDDLGRNREADEVTGRLSNVGKLYRAHPISPLDRVYAFYYSGLGTPFDDSAEAAFSVMIDEVEDKATDHGKDSVKDAVNDEVKDKAKDFKDNYERMNRTVEQKRALLGARARQLDKQAGRVRRAAARSGDARAQKIVARSIAAEAGEIRHQAATAGADAIKAGLRRSLANIKRTSFKSLISKKAILKLAAGVSVDLIPATRDNGYLSQLLNLGPDIRLETAKEELKFVVEDAVKRQDANRPVAEVFVSVFGGGRGGALAKAFSNDVPSSMQGMVNGVKYDVSIKLHYLGLFDAMHAMSGSMLEFLDPVNGASFFAPNNPLWFFVPISPNVNMDDRDLQVPGFMGGLHLIAGQENRLWQRLSLNSGNDRVKQVVTGGIHEDVAGGYVDGEDGRQSDFARGAVLSMYQHALDWGVQFFGHDGMGFKTSDGKAQPLEVVAGEVFNRYFAARPGTADVLQLHESYLAWVNSLGGPSTASIPDQLSAHHQALLHWAGYARKNLPTYWVEAQKSVDDAIARAGDLLSQVRGAEPVGGKHVDYTPDGVPVTTYKSPEARQADEQWHLHLDATTSLYDDLKTQRERLGTLEQKIDHDVKALRERSAMSMMDRNPYLAAKIGAPLPGMQEQQDHERKTLAAWDNATQPLPQSLVPLFQNYLHDPVVSGTGDYAAVGLLYMNNVSYFNERRADVGEKASSISSTVEKGYEFTKEAVKKASKQIVHMFD
ncbi:hypothetical protein LMG28688_05713 [Paraburkholderia caffeinitolerans]|uniref:DUF2235 domain-containing protein n=1 Tax=Paraburkholderia caffeinitolerans TaxID=1723730 RepID=A0A6J5GNV6_9BURK|nr:hypothetical protein [Paraburkholderia caffeinitolerans]CAB3803137.1 hypothetical protein LMG28688_05713 [Paraburkholderia caffeinitolerans]